MKLSISGEKSDGGAQLRISDSLSSKSVAVRLKKRMKLSDVWHVGRNKVSAHGIPYTYFALMASAALVSARERKRIESIVDFKRATKRRALRADRQAAKRKPNAFVASIAALQAIIDAPRVKRTGKRSVFNGKRKKQSRNEKRLQKAARNYVESLNRGIIVVQWDHQGNPDHLYLIPRKRLWYIVAVEFKDLGKKPEKHQAKKIIGLLNRMPVEVISDINTFKAWFNRITK